MASTPLLLRWALVNMFLTAGAAGLTLFIWTAESDVRTHLAKAQKRNKVGCKPARVTRPPAPKPAPAPDEPEVEPPPQDPPKTGYIGERGADITPTMRLYLEALRGKGESVESLRLGAQDVLPSGAIHVVNLWATWCAPCKAEMPDFKAMFERHAEWGESVRFVPILVKDAAEPRSAYQSFASTMPAAAVKLSDRALGDPLVSALTPEDKSVRLFHGNLPVTFVLDCNRRVRWARFEQLTEADFAELEQFVEQFRGELADTSEGAWCRQEWPGNGRCEGRESTAAQHSLEDCGELKPARRYGGEPGAGGEEGLIAGEFDLDPIPVPDPAPVVSCPSGQVRMTDGRCADRPRKEAPPTKTAKTTMICGDGVCEPARGESKVTCCQDCACGAPLTCKPAVNDTYSCQVGLK